MASEDKKTTLIDVNNWNRLSTYSFEIGEIGEDGEITMLPTPPSPNDPGSAALGAISSASSADKPDFIKRGTSVVLRLPPQSLTIQTQFANTVTATNKGILEENSGVVFRTISLSGTTGVWPDRPQAVEPPGGAMKAISAFFPGAVAGLSNLKKAAKKTLGAASGLISQAKNLTTKSENDEGMEADLGSLTTSQLTETGYYQFWDLYNWFVDYAEFKKTADGKKYCLLFNNAKDNICYAVTPLAFDLRRDAKSPLLYNYSIALRAWKVINANYVKGKYNKGLDIRNPSFVKQLLEVIRRGRKTVQAAEGLLSGIQSDIADIVDIVAQTNMLAKDAIGATATLLDMPKLIRNNAVAIWKYNGSQMQGALTRLKNSQDWSQGQRKDALKIATGIGLGIAIGIAAPIAVGAVAVAGAAAVAAMPLVAAVAGAQYVREKVLSGKKGSGEETPVVGTSSNEPTTMELGLSDKSDKKNTSENPDGQKQESTASSALVEQAVKEILSDPDVADSINFNELKFPPDLEEQINNLMDQAGQINSGDVLKIAGRLQNLSDNIAAAAGMLGVDYAKIYNIPSSTTGSKAQTEDYLIMMSNIQDMTNAMICLTVSQDIFSNNKRPDTYTDLNEALPDEHKMPIPFSYYPVTVNMDDTMESIADRYLGDAKKYQEIVNINGLRAPYVDHAGFILTIGKCTENTFVVSNSDGLIVKDIFRPNQVITLSGTGQASSRRYIKKIEYISDGTQAKITVSGSNDLLVINGGNINPRYGKVFSRKPQTIGAGDTVLIPTQKPGNLPDIPRATPRMDAIPFAEKLFMIDIGLDKNGDIKVNASGDLDRSTGYTNAIQAIRLAIETERGELKNHKDFGIPDIVGRRNSTITKESIRQIIKNRVLRDPRFENARVFIDIEGSVVKIRVEAFGANGTGLIPVEFQFTI